MRETSERRPRCGDCWPSGGGRQKRSSRGASSSRAARRTRRSRSRPRRSPDPRRMRTRAWLMRESRVGRNGKERVCQDRSPETSRGRRDARSRGKIRETSDNTHEAQRSTHACSPRASTESRTRGSRQASPTAGKSCLRACAPAVKTVTRQPRACSRSAPFPRHCASGSRPSSGKTSTALEGEGMATARAGPNGDSLVPLDTRARAA